MLVGPNEVKQVTFSQYEVWKNNPEGNAIKNQPIRRQIYRSEKELLIYYWLKKLGYYKFIDLAQDTTKIIFNKDWVKE